MIIYVRSVNPEYDSRLNKFAGVIDKSNYDYTILWWNRLNEMVVGDKKEKMVEFKRNGKLGRRWKNLIGLLFWNIYIFYWLARNFKKVNVVHAIDFDCIVPSFLFARIFRKKIIFDVYDKYSDAKSISGFLGKIINKLENYFINYSDCSILVDDCRFEQHGIKRKNSIVVIENVPDDIPNKLFQSKVKKDFLTLGYFGSLEAKHRGLEDLINVVIASSNLKLIIAGYGELASYIKEAASRFPEKIDFHGMLTSIEGLSLMSYADIYIGMYYKTNKNHLWAAPNKYYEHLLLGLPLLTTCGTPPGRKVTLHRTGWSIGEGQDNLNCFFSNVSRDEIKDYSNNSSNLWRESFSSYYDKSYKGLYFRIVSKLISVK